MFTILTRVCILSMTIYLGCLSVTVAAEKHRLMVVIVTAEQDPRDFGVFASSVHAQLSDLEVEVKVKVTKTSNLNGDISSWKELAKKERGDEQSEMVVLVGEQSIGMYFDDGVASDFVTREFPRYERWEDSSDATASIIRSGLESWLLAHSGGDTAQAEVESASEGKETEKDPPSESISKRREGLSIGGGVTAGYVLQVVSMKEAVLHGAYFGAALRLTPWVSLTAGADVLQMTRWNQYNWTFSFRRIPIRVGLSGHWTLKRLTVGVSASLLVDLTEIKGEVLPFEEWVELEDGPEPSRLPPGERKEPEFVDEGKRTFLGFAPGAFVSVSLVKWMSLYLNFNCDLYFGDREFFLANDATVYENNLAQYRISLGTTFWFVNR